MTKKMTSADALSMAMRIEALQEQIDAIYRETSEFEGFSNDIALREIVEGRKKIADLTSETQGLIDSLDITDED